MLILLVKFNIENLTCIYSISFNVFIYIFNFKLLKNLKNFSLHRNNGLLVIYFVSLLIPFSNSFVINENNCLCYLLITIISLLVLNKKPTEGEVNRLSIYLNSLLILVLCRLTSLFYICREETQFSCKRTSFTMPLKKLLFDTYFDYIIKSTIYFLLSLISVLFIYFKYFDAYLIGKLKFLFRFQLILLGLYWFLQVHYNNNGDDNTKNSMLNTYIPRVYYLLTLSQLTLWLFKFNSGYKYNLNIFVMILFQLIVLLIGENRSISIVLLIFTLEWLKIFVQNFKRK